MLLCICGRWEHLYFCRSYDWLTFALRFVYGTLNVNWALQNELTWDNPITAVLSTVNVCWQDWQVRDAAYRAQL